MTQDPNYCQQILALLANRATLTTIADVIQVMQALDTLLLPSDGVKWFNWLYLNVTQSVYKTSPTTNWQDPHWLDQLDIIFAQFYFDALSYSCTDPTKVPQAWMALFEVRDNPDIERVQFALAGVNAHINHDLPLALVQTDKDLHVPPDRDSSEYSDFENVNSILNEVLPQTLNVLATGILGEMMEDTGTIGRLLAMWSVETARDTAWTNGELLWDIQDIPAARENFLTALDRLTGLAGRGLLTCV